MPSSGCPCEFRYLGSFKPSQARMPKHLSSGCCDNKPKNIYAAVSSALLNGEYKTEIVSAPSGTYKVLPSS